MRKLITVAQLMEISWIVLLALAAVLSYISITRHRRSERNHPPGPKPWPIIGNLNLLGSIPHQSLHELSRKHGELMLLRIGKFPVVVASSPEMAKQFLKVHDSVFASRPRLTAGHYISYRNSLVALAPYGPYWRQTRKIVLSEVLHPKKLESFEQIRVDVRRGFLSSLRALSGKPVALREEFSRYALSTVSRMLLREEYSKKMDELREVAEGWFYLSGVFNVGDWIPWLNWLDLQGYVRKMKALSKKMDRYYVYVIEDHLTRRTADDGDVGTDVVDSLLQIAEDPSTEVLLTKDCVKGLLQNLLLGGTDTSATTVEWSVQEILRQPRILKKAKDELDRVIGRNRWVEEDDFPQLPYIDAIIKETFRLHPPSTFIPHYAIEDGNVAGYDIAKGTTVLINVWSIGRDPNSWDSPEEFFPERFIDKDIDITGNNFALLPFGSGRRGCPGSRLGLKMVWTAVANLVHGFELKLGEGMRPGDISMEEEYGLITHPKYPLPIVMEPTLPAHLYG